MAGIEKEIAHRGPPNDGPAVQRRGPQSGPRLHVIFQVEVQRICRVPCQRGQAPFVDAIVEPDEIGHPGDPDNVLAVLPERRVDDRPGGVGHGVAEGRRPRGWPSGDTVPLDRVDRQAEARPLRDSRRFRTKGHHDDVRPDLALTRIDGTDGAAVSNQITDLCAEMPDNIVSRPEAGRQLEAKRPAIPDLIARSVHAPDKLSRIDPERRLDLEAFGGREEPSSAGFIGGGSSSASRLAPSNGAAFW